MFPKPPCFIEEYFSRRFPYQSEKDWIAQIKNGDILVNGLVARTGYVLKEGDRIVTHAGLRREPPVNRSLKVVYEDFHVRVFNNLVLENNLYNFAPEGNIVAKVPAGTGIMILAASNVEIFDNIISNNKNKLIISYENSKINIDTIISKLKTQNVEIIDISTDDGDLEDVFLRLTKD